MVWRAQYNLVTEKKEKRFLNHNANQNLSTVLPVWPFLLAKNTCSDPYVDYQTE